MVLGGVVEEGEQNVELLGHPGGRLGPFGEGLGEAGDRVERGRPRGCRADGGEGRPRLLVLALGEGVQDIGRLVHPPTLLGRLGEDVAQGGPEAQGAVAGGQGRRHQAALTQVAQQLLPALGRLAVAVREGHQLLGPVRAHAHDDQAAQAVLLEADTEVDAIHPPVDVSTPERSRRPQRSCSACQATVSRLTVDADRPASEPKNDARAGAKSPVERPRRYRMGSTSLTFGLRRA